MTHELNFGVVRWCSATSEKSSITFTLTQHAQRPRATIFESHPGSRTKPPSREVADRTDADSPPPNATGHIESSQLESEGATRKHERGYAILIEPPQPLLAESRSRVEKRNLICTTLRFSHPSELLIEYEVIKALRPSPNMPDIDRKGVDDESECAKPTGHCLESDDSGEEVYVGIVQPDDYTLNPIFSSIPIRGANYRSIDEMAATAILEQSLAPLPTAGCDDLIMILEQPYHMRIFDTFVDSVELDGMVAYRSDSVDCRHLGLAPDHDLTVVHRCPRALQERRLLRTQLSNLEFREHSMKICVGDDKRKLKDNIRSRSEDEGKLITHDELLQINPTRTDSIVMAGVVSGIGVTAAAALLQAATACCNALVAMAVRATVAARAKELLESSMEAFGEERRYEFPSCGKHALEIPVFVTPEMEITVGGRQGARPTMSRLFIPTSLQLPTRPFANEATRLHSTGIFGACVGRNSPVTASSHRPYGANYTASQAATQSTRTTGQHFSSGSRGDSGAPRLTARARQMWSGRLEQEVDEEEEVDHELEAARLDPSSFAAVWRATGFDHIRGYRTTLPHPIDTWNCCSLLPITASKLPFDPSRTPARYCSPLPSRLYPSPVHYELDGLDRVPLLRRMWQYEDVSHTYRHPFPSEPAVPDLPPAEGGSLCFDLRAYTGERIFCEERNDFATDHIAYTLQHRISRYASMRHFEVFSHTALNTFKRCLLQRKYDMLAQMDPFCPDFPRRPRHWISPPHIARYLIGEPVAKRFAAIFTEKGAQHRGLYDIGGFMVQEGMLKPAAEEWLRAVERLAEDTRAWHEAIPPKDRDDFMRHCKAVRRADGAAPVRPYDDDYNREEGYYVPFPFRYIRMAPENDRYDPKDPYKSVELPIDAMFSRVPVTQFTFTEPEPFPKDGVPVEKKRGFLKKMPSWSKRSRKATVPPKKDLIWMRGQAEMALEWTARADWMSTFHDWPMERIPRTVKLDSFTQAQARKMQEERDRMERRIPSAPPLELDQVTASQEKIFRDGSNSLCDRIPSASALEETDSDYEEQFSYPSSGEDKTSSDDSTSFDDDSSDLVEEMCDLVVTEEPPRYVSVENLQLLWRPPGERKKEEKDPLRSTVRGPIAKGTPSTSQQTSERLDEDERRRRVEHAMESMADNEKKIRRALEDKRAQLWNAFNSLNQVPQPVQPAVQSVFSSIWSSSPAQPAVHPMDAPSTSATPEDAEWQREDERRRKQEEHQRLFRGIVFHHTPLDEWQREKDEEAARQAKRMRMEEGGAAASKCSMPATERTQLQSSFSLKSALKPVPSSVADEMLAAAPIPDVPFRITIRPPSPAAPRTAVKRPHSSIHAAQQDIARRVSNFSNRAPIVMSKLGQRVYAREKHRRAVRAAIREQKTAREAARRARMHNEEPTDSVREEEAAADREYAEMAAARAQARAIKRELYSRLVPFHCLYDKLTHHAGILQYHTTRARYAMTHVSALAEHWPVPVGVSNVVRAIIDPSYDPAQDANLPEMGDFVKELRQLEEGRKHAFHDSPLLMLDPAIEDPLDLSCSRSAAPRHYHYIDATHNFELKTAHRTLIGASRVFWRDGYDAPDDAPYAHQAAKVWYAFLMASGRATARFMPVLSRRQLTVIFMLFSMIGKSWTKLHAEVAPHPKVLQCVTDLLINKVVLAIPKNVVPRPLAALSRVSKVATVRSAAVFKMEDDDFLSTLITFFWEFESPEVDEMELKTAFALAEDDDVCQGCSTSMIRDEERRAKKEVKKLDDELVNVNVEDKKRIREKLEPKTSEGDVYTAFVEDRIWKSEKKERNSMEARLLESIQSAHSERVPMPGDFDWNIHQIVQIAPEFAQRWTHERRAIGEVDMDGMESSIRRRIGKELKKDWWSTVGGEFVMDYMDANPSADSARARTLDAPKGRQRSTSVSEMPSSASKRSVDWRVSLALPDIPLTKNFRHPLWVARAAKRAIGSRPKPVVDIWDPNLHETDTDTGHQDSLIVQDWKMAVDAESNATLSQEMATMCEELCLNPNRTFDTNFIPMQFSDWRASQPDWTDADAAARGRYRWMSKRPWKREYPSHLPIPNDVDEDERRKYEKYRLLGSHFEQARQSGNAAMAGRLAEELELFEPFLCSVKKERASSCPQDPKQKDE